MAKAPPGPPSPPITPGTQGWPSREKLNALVATLGVFEWCEANGLLDTEMGELRRARDAFMFDWGATAERWREQQGDEPSWSQMAALVKENQQLKEERNGPPSAASDFTVEQIASPRDLQRSLSDVLDRLRRSGSLLLVHHSKPVAVLTAIDAEENPHV